MDAAVARRCFSPSLGGCCHHGWRCLRGPCRLTIWASGGVPFVHLRCIWGSPFEAHSPLALFQQVGMFSVKGGVIVVEYLKKAKEKLVDTIPRLENPKLRELRL